MKIFELESKLDSITQADKKGEKYLDPYEKDRLTLAVLNDISQTLFMLNKTLADTNKVAKRNTRALEMCLGLATEPGVTPLEGVQMFQKILGGMKVNMERLAKTTGGSRETEED